MEFSQDDFERLLMFEHTRKTAEENYKENPLDADVRIILHSYPNFSSLVFIHIFELLYSYTYAIS